MSDGKDKSLLTSLYFHCNSLLKKIDYDDLDPFSYGLKTPRKPTNIIYTLSVLKPRVSSSTSDRIQCSYDCITVNTRSLIPQ